MTAPIVLQKVIFPSSADPDVTPLYVDPDEWSDFVQVSRPRQDEVKHRRGVIPDDVALTPLRLTHHNVIPMLDGRRGLRPGHHRRVSLGTYFNAFPASYWRRWTTIGGVRLHVVSRGTGDIIVYRSNARGVIQVVDSAHVSDTDTTTSFDLGFDNFIDGGWYWFDLVSGGEGFGLVEAEWQAPPATEHADGGGRLSIGITTLNRADYCLGLLATIASDSDVLAEIDRVTVVDQGSTRIRDQARFAEVDTALGGKLNLIEQVNAGGSGGFSRGMLETLAAGDSAYHMLIDDDVVIEPESIRRALTFARLCTTPTIVGGHMFDMYDKTKLHAFAESIDEWNFMWGPVTPGRHDFTSSNLRQTTWMHERIDVAYNGWWMSLIPVKVIREIGLSLPVFIKWDDAEFSLRARDHGYPTVSLPGAAIWHVSWVDKDDSRDWQAFYHARNRLIAAMLHSSHRHGGRLPLSNFASDVRFLLTMDYYTVKLRQLAYESVLAGPKNLHAELTTRLPAIRELSAEYEESSLVKDLSTFDSFPTTTYLGTTGRRPTGRRLRRFLLTNFIRHGLRPSEARKTPRPTAHLPSRAPWWVQPDYDSVAITNAEGSGVSWHLRDREKFRSLFWSSLTLNLRYRRRWPALSRIYRKRLPELTSVDTWRKTLGLADTVPETREPASST